VIGLMRELMNNLLAGRFKRWLFQHHGCLKSHRVSGVRNLNIGGWEKFIR
jgi:hypothetical protein